MEGEKVYSIPPKEVFITLEVRMSSPYKAPDPPASGAEGLSLPVTDLSPARPAHCGRSWIAVSPRTLPSMKASPCRR